MKTAISIGVAIVLSSCDPTHDDLVARLGDEAPGVARGPLHRPGQPCGACHADFSVSGTIYVTAEGTTPAAGARVTLLSANGATYGATANEAGNFYVKSTEFVPEYPIGAYVSWQTSTVRMSARVGRQGSCAGCHADPAGPSSPGRVFVSEGKAP